MSEKILIICNVLDVTSYELLGGTKGVGSRSNPSDMILIDENYNRCIISCIRRILMPRRQNVCYNRTKDNGLEGELCVALGCGLSR